MDLEQELSMLGQKESIMDRKKLMNISHYIVAEMYKDILDGAGIKMYISEKNGPHIMEIYLGQGHEGLDLYVDEEDYEEAKKIVEEAQIVDD